MEVAGKAEPHPTGTSAPDLLNIRCIKVRRKYGSIFSDLERNPSS
jgi:hypothetical protein